MRRLHLRIPALMIALTVAVCLGVAGTMLAQQTGDQPARPATGKAAVRAQVVKLRVDVELLQLDQDSDRAFLLDLVKAAREFEMVSPSRRRQVTEMAMYFFSEEGEEGKDVETIIKKRLAAAAALIKTKKNDYAKQAAELNEKRLELAEAEKRYSEAQ